MFRRSVQLGYERPADRRHRDPWFETFASTLWEHADPATAASALSVPLRPSEVSDVTMVVEEGDNSPLPESPECSCCCPRIGSASFRPASATLRLLYGDDRVRGTLLRSRAARAPRAGAAATEATLAAEPAAATAPVNGLVAPRIFWALIALAVVALLAV